MRELKRQVAMLVAAATQQAASTPWTPSASVCGDDDGGPGVTSSPGAVPPGAERSSEV